MSRAKALVEAVTFDALSSAISGATVYQDAPVNAPGDLVILGEMKSFRLATKEAEGDRRVTIAIVTIVEAEDPPRLIYAAFALLVVGFNLKFFALPESVLFHWALLILSIVVAGFTLRAARAYGRGAHV
jgi:hypothetical protein